MPNSGLARLLELAEELAARSREEEVEYWRGYLLGLRRRSGGIDAEDKFQHRFWMGFTVRGRGETGFEKYAEGYRDGYKPVDSRPDAEAARLLDRLTAGGGSRTIGADGASASASPAMNCWEFMKCGREKGGSREAELGVCPAYPDYGRSCARLLGTLCEGTVHGSMAKKLKDCMKCPFFQSGHYERIREKD